MSNAHHLNLAHRAVREPLSDATLIDVRRPRSVPSIVVSALPHRMREGVSFLFVGGVSFLVDFGIFNLLAALGMNVLGAKLLSTILSVAVAYVGNRYLTFAAARTGSMLRQVVMFLVANGIGAALALATLGVSHYVLGFANPIADNIAGNVIGVLLGTAARYVLYRTLVFRTPEEGTRR